MNILWLWAAALFIYLGFLSWYQNWQGPLTAGEIETYMARLAEGTPNGATDPAVLRRFLEKDDGREFFMLNLVKLHEGKVPDPQTGELKSSQEILSGYTSSFFKALFKRAGHPAIAARIVGGHVDSWNVAENPDWTVMGWMRYRSRRDAMELVTDPAFKDGHMFKVAAIPATFSVPTSPMISLMAGPRIWAALGLALAAALGSIVLLFLRQPGA